MFLPKYVTLVAGYVIPTPTSLLCSYQNYYKMSKAVLFLYSHRIRSFYIQTQFEIIIDREYHYKNVVVNY